MPGLSVLERQIHFTTNSKLESNAKTVMSVEESFNFEGMDFAKHSPLYFDGNIYLPNPLALIYLKMRSYYYNPQRPKDFVDFMEIILRMATEDKVLIDLRKIALSNPVKQVKDNFVKVCVDIEEDRGGTWDLDDIKREMDSRGLLSEFEWSEIPQTVEFFRTKVF